MIRIVPRDLWRSAQPRQPRPSEGWRAGFAVALAIAIAAIVIGVVSREPIASAGAVAGGPFWQAPIAAWIGVVLLAALALLAESQIARLVAVIAFGLATMGVLGYIEPLGVFHDSWQNVGLGQIVVSPDQAAAAQQVPYVASTPGSFMLVGILRSAFPDTPSFLRVFPTLCVLFYCAGVYTLALAFADAHGGALRVERARFGALSAFAFLALAPLFWVRVNPAPQSLAFAFMPFCLAAVLNGFASVRFRALALIGFGLIVATHPITAVMTIGVGGAWLLLDGLVRRRPAAHPVVVPNTLVLYGCVFLSWLIYVGVWIIRTGGSFVRRMFDVLDSGQHAVVTANTTEQLLAFIWLHRVSMLGGGLIVVAGIVLLLRAHLPAGMRLVAWCMAAAIWLPMMLFGEFADRGPLFAALPAALAAGYALSTITRYWARRLIVAVMLATVLTGYITAYTNHVGEIVTGSELAAFKVIADQSAGRKIVYGYVPPLTGDDLSFYSNNAIRAYALGAADFSYDRLTSAGDVIVISDQMRESARLRGPKAQAELERFEAYLLNHPHYQLIFDNGSVRAFRAR